MAGLSRYIVIRASLIVPTILILYTFVFILLRVLPGDPILAVVGTRYIPPAQLEEMRRMAGLDKPILVQYFDYLLGVILRGDFGKTLASPVGKPVSEYLWERLPATIELTIASFIVASLIGFITGVGGALRRGSRLDTLIRIYSILTYTLFIPVLGMGLQYLLGLKLKLFYISGRLSPGIHVPKVTGLLLLDSLLAGDLSAFTDALRHIVLPSLTLGIVLSGAYTRLIRNNLIEVLNSDFIRAYRARGIPDHRVTMYAIKNAFIPVVTYMGLQIAMLLGGAILTETTFSWPGLGRFIYERIEYRDYSSIQGAVILFAFIVGLMNLVVDIMYALIDPRVKY
ncbi:MAG: ABC transporter permease [Desulfurococcaceae archaeon]